MQTRVVGLIVVVIIGTTIISMIAAGLPSIIIQAYAGAVLNSDDVAKTMRVRINVAGFQDEITIDSFSRIGFVRGSNEFLLESLPSEDKKPFYELVQSSFSAKSPFATQEFLDIYIDLYSGGGQLIETLNYKRCTITEYFVHTIDSKGKYRFLEDDNSRIEIREVTKFKCSSFTITF